MAASTVGLYSLSYRDLRTYAISAAFIAGNILLPQLCHLIPNGGVTWLPIYFFTLIAAYKYGWRAGLLTALLSPAVNCLLFGMPALAMLPVISVKSVLLASAAGYAAYRYHRVTLWTIAAVVVAYQAAGTLFEWAWTSDLAIALQDLHIGFPGILMQIIGGFIILRYILKK